MRDDLHKSVPPRTTWSRLLRLAQLPTNDPELKEALVRAVRGDASWLGMPWGNELDMVLAQGASDLFAEEGVRRKLLELQKSPPTHNARAAIEIALGLLARDGQVSAGFKSAVMDQALRLHASDCIEHLASCVAAKFGPKQASLIRAHLHAVLKGCDLTREPPRRARRPRASIEDGLAMPMALNL